MNKESLIPLLYIAALIFGVAYLKKILDDLFPEGDDIAGYAGENEQNMGWGAWLEFLQSGGFVNEYEQQGGDIPWYLEYSPAFSVYRWLQ